jgi:hypothetical protein
MVGYCDLYIDVPVTVTHGVLDTSYSGKLVTVAAARRLISPLYPSGDGDNGNGGKIVSFSFALPEECCTLP